MIETCVSDGALGTPMLRRCRRSAPPSPQLQHLALARRQVVERRRRAAGGEKHARPPSGSSGRAALATRLTAATNSPGCAYAVLGR